MIKLGQEIHLIKDFKILHFMWEKRVMLIELLNDSDPASYRCHIPLACELIKRGYHPYKKWIDPTTRVGKSTYYSTHQYIDSSYHHVLYNKRVYKIEYTEGESGYSLVRKNSTIKLKCQEESVANRNSACYKLKTGYHSKRRIHGKVVSIERILPNNDRIQYTSAPNWPNGLYKDHEVLVVVIQDPLYYTEYEVPLKFVE